MDPDENEFEPALESAHRKAISFLDSLKTRPVASTAAAPPGAILPEVGGGAVAALDRVWKDYGAAFSGSSGPRYWGFVHGGLTPAALAADWLCSTIDQTGQQHSDSPSTYIERDAIAMLRDLFGLPEGFTGNFVSGGTMANASSLAIGLQALGAAKGVSVAAKGIAALGPVRILSGEHHSSIRQAAAMLGLGRDCIERLHREPNRESVDIAAMERRLTELDGHSVIIVGNAGTANTGDFDNLEALADLAEHHHAHFHVDGAFGLFAAVSPKHAHLLKGVERAGTISGDAHKWLNVPYDSGFLFTRHLDHQIAMFESSADYLPPATVDPLAFQNMSPENSRRLRALPAWVTLQAYGRRGYRDIVERCCALAERLGERIDASPDFKLLAPVWLNVVCFQLLDGASPASADRTREFVERVKQDGRLVVSKSQLWGEPCIRVALVNWRTNEEDIEIAMNVFEDVIQ